MIDVAVFHPVQLHFTATPVFEVGVADPVPKGRRSGLCAGQFDAVALVLGPNVIAAALAAQERKANPKAEGKDPAEKGGWVGAFCAVYTPDDLHELLPDYFTPSEGRARHFDWSGHDPAGVYITSDGKHIGNVHNSDPAGGRACNIFDVCRLHLFGHLDRDIREGGRMTERPSYLAMIQWIKDGHSEVVEQYQQWLEEERAAAEEAFLGLDDPDEAPPQADLAEKPAGTLPSPSDRAAALPAADSGPGRKPGVVPFRVAAQGVFFVGTEKNGQERAPLWVCSTLRVIAKTRDDNGAEWGRLLEWPDDDGRPHQWAMPMELLEGDGIDVRKELARQGLRTGTARGAKELLAWYIKEWPV